MFYLVIAFKILLPLYSVGLAKPLTGDKVERAAEGEFPFVVSIGLAVGGRGHFCTGSLITAKHVLTAAHCFSNVHRARNIRVLVGTNNLNKGGTRYRLSSVDGWITFDSWAKQTYSTHFSQYSWNDIAIVTLSREVEEDIRMPRITLQRNEEHYKKTVVTAGWGDTSNGSKPNNLHKAYLYLMSRDEFENNMVNLTYPIEHAYVNELATNADPPVFLGCGDSGGPLLINGDQIIGVNEAVCPIGHPRHTLAFNLHTSVYYYASFISIVTNMVL